MIISFAEYHSEYFWLWEFMVTNIYFETAAFFSELKVSIRRHFLDIPSVFFWAAVAVALQLENIVENIGDILSSIKMTPIGEVLHFINTITIKYII